MQHIFVSATFAAATLFAGGWATGCDALREGPTDRVVAVTDGDTLTLAGGSQVRLVGIQAPKLPLGRDGFATWPLADEALAALEDLVLGSDVDVRYGGEQADRHGRLLGHVFVGDTWVQQAMLAAGLARVYSFADNRFCVAEMMAAEASARADGRGIWADPWYAVRRADRPEEVLAREGHFELVEGRVLNAAQAGPLVYLNFGRYWREDFTIVIDTAGRRLFEEAEIDPLAFEDALIRVRGWIDSHDGPRVSVTHPEQIEVLSQR